MLKNNGSRTEELEWIYNFIHSFNTHSEKSSFALTLKGSFINSKTQHVKKSYSLIKMQ